MKLGARIFKTGLSVILSLYIAELLKLESSMVAAIAAALSVFPSIHRSWDHLRQQLQANIIGATFAIIGFLTFGNSPLAMGLVVILVIATNLKLKLDKTIALSVVIVIVIMQVPNGHSLEFAFGRIFLLLIGIFSSLLINLLFLPPKNEKKLFKQISSTNEQLLLLLRLSMEDEQLSKKTFKEEKEKLGKAMDNIKELSSFYKDEFYGVFKKKGYQQRKKLIVIRQMIRIMEKQLVLMSLLKNDICINERISNEIKEEIREAIMQLSSYNEKIFFKYQKRIFPKMTHELPKDVAETNKTLSKKLIVSYQEENEKDWHHILPTVSSLIDLTYDLERLEKQVDNYIRTR